MGLGQKHNRAKSEIVELKKQIAVLINENKDAERRYSIMGQAFMEYSDLTEEEVLILHNERSEKIERDNRLGAGVIISQLLSSMHHGRL